MIKPHGLPGQIEFHNLLLSAQLAIAMDIIVAYWFYNPLHVIPLKFVRLGPNDKKQHWLSQFVAIPEPKITFFTDADMHHQISLSQIEWIRRFWAIWAIDW